MNRYLIRILSLCLAWLGVIGGVRIEALAGSFEVINQSNPTIINCIKGDINCGFYSPVIFKNVTGEMIYNTTVWTSGGVLEFTEAGGSYVKGQSVFNQVFEPNNGPNLGVRVIVPTSWNAGTYYERLYIDGKTCNVGTTPPDCVFYGGGEFVVVIKLTDGITPTMTPSLALTPTLTPTLTLVPTLTSTPTSTLTPTSFPTVTLTPTVTSTPTSPQKNNNNGGGGNNSGSGSGGGNSGNSGGGSSNSGGGLSSGNVVACTVLPQNKKNRLPRFLTSRLFSGKVNKPYGTWVSASDPDGECVNIRPVSLPVGLNAKCTNGNNASCLVTGTILRKGLYRLIFEIKDSRGKLVKKTYSLTIVK